MIPVHHFVKLLLVAVSLLLGVVLHAGQGASSGKPAKTKTEQVPQAVQKCEVSLLLPVVLL